MNTDKIRVVQETPSLGYVNALGYVSLFPFLLKIIEPDSPKLSQILSDIKNPQVRSCVCACFLIDDSSLCQYITWFVSWSPIIVFKFIFLF